MKLEQTIQRHLEKLSLPLQGEVLDYVLYLEQKNKKQISPDSERRVRLAHVLEQVVAINPYSAIDPAKWTQEQRHDRALPDRS